MNKEKALMKDSGHLRVMLECSGHAMGEDKKKGFLSQGRCILVQANSVVCTEAPEGHDKRKAFKHTKATD
jgi:hypothetical protein